MNETAENTCKIMVSTGIKPQTPENVVLFNLKIIFILIKQMKPQPHCGKMIDLYIARLTSGCSL